MKERTGERLKRNGGRGKKRWRKEKTTKEVNECPSPDGVVI